MDMVWRCVLGLMILTAIVSCLNDIDMVPLKSQHLLAKDESLTLKCRTRYVEGLQLKWTSEKNIPLVLSQGFTVANNFENDMKYSVATLNIIKYQPNMKGSYSCQLKNMSSSGSLVNEYTVQLHTLIKENEDVMFYRDNNTLKLTCKIEAEDAKVSEPEWRKGDTLISDVVTDGSIYEPQGENLTIKDVMRSDAALYTAKYEVTFMDDTFKYDCQVALKAEPLVLDFDKSKNLIQEDNLELQCKTLGYPYPVVMWYKDSELVDGGLARVTMEDLKGVKNGTLKIKSVDYDDAGTYKCVALTEELKANSSKTITVRVKDKYAALWPFLGIVAEVVVLCTIIFIYEKHRSRQAEREEAAQDEPEPVKKGNVRNRRTQK